MNEPAKTQMPTAVLKAEHQVILRVIDVLSRLVDRADRGDGFETEALRRCVDFLRFFADACHHAKEEDLLFPLLETRGIPRDGGPIGVMLSEHTLARGFTRDMGAALDEAKNADTDAQKRFSTAARRYIELLPNHIYKEDNVLYTMGDRAMTKEDQASLCDKFREVGCNAFGGKTRDELERIADELEHDWPAG